ncbi:glycosyltransferase family 2 protein [Brevundimonas lenta]|uniref:Cellulose synthase/poly-beta-1,6-N-acetylglucosamine synthase-like glycosyltransferase n=1 Tax=Brevundimonas lenta TaxID=424796 RepID=A0A7W6JFS0_9CAUL|nr:glycosyltransferase family 2 protein [Brevundimonas lenta]MBB4083307.1 cellulose synthase/poly-beta-1,6-N-acetylglucosamine synthase-like glycosyltransferase [Brevundimonas lenta]
MGDVAVIIPTLRRPESLERALRSLFKQTGVADRLNEVVVVDNDPTGSAAATVEALRPYSPWGLVYRHAPQPGVATARNEGLRATAAPLIAFLDDDEAASPGWLAALLKAQETTGADVVFGPITGRAPDAKPWLKPWLEKFFGREGPDTTRLIDHSYGCGNSLMVRANALRGCEPFNTAADHAGGEDDALFAALKARGGRFGWAADARVEEFAPAHRATLEYALARAFAYGQGPSQTAATAQDWPAVVRWMFIGGAQTVVYGTAAAGLTLIGSPKRADFYDRTARGIGKLFWMKGFEPHFYGARELARLDRTVAASPVEKPARTRSAGQPVRRFRKAGGL